MWDPTVAICASDGSRISPALALGHELAHAEGGFWTVLLSMISDDQFQNLEERRVITGAEAAAAITLGEGLRTSHYGSFYPVSSPTQR